mmetsp:Transcript_6637/g.14478  ORF Transcript_6637/g.14478 Transcript_6637/m.14478 type:complete len:417 (+) Transcript_6637:108-1358(+)|eukprot:CAMPEP_0178388772 /NCGR_PEP_ID=MMETSP0689_2-20121128/9766_1 /TAXON_ID=160604 /ORGANISM="Amphidinium massartii, Strain CS-259" /LENGTH=416 /DNA_ID=CAMNT_0020009187 /DNA_START=47 /DNA_END=1297 /DNA_ORIENTATION=+
MAEETYAELVGFLQDQKFEVQRFAVEGVLESTEDEGFIAYCKDHPRQVAKPLLRLMERAESVALEAAGDTGSGKADAERRAAVQEASAKVAAADALKALVNLSTVPQVRDALIDLSAAKRCGEAMRKGWLEGSAELAHWHAMVLANVTTTQPGQESLCDNEGLLSFLVAAFIANPRPPPRDGYDDPLSFLGKVLINSTAVAKGRRILASENGSSVGMLTPELAQRGRRHDVLTVLRNLCVDVQCHSAVVATDMLQRIALFIYPLADVAPEYLEKLPSALREVLSQQGAAMTGEISVRIVAAACFVGLCQSDQGLQHLTENGGEEICRAWLDKEHHADTKSVLKAVQDYIRSGVAAGSAESQTAAGDNLEAQAEDAADSTAEPRILGEVAVVRPGPSPVKEEGELSGLFASIEGEGS